MDTEWRDNTYHKEYQLGTGMQTPYSISSSLGGEHSTPVPQLCKFALCSCEYRYNGRVLCLEHRRAPYNSLWKQAFLSLVASLDSMIVRIIRARDTLLRQVVEFGSRVGGRFACEKSTFHITVASWEHAHTYLTIKR